MGFRPTLVTESQGVTREASFLASEHIVAKRVGITVNAASVTADAAGNKIVKAGTAMGKITATGKYRPYNNTNLDGSETCVGLLFETINLRDGDQICGLLIHGSVIEARTTGVDASAKTDLAGAVIFQ